MRRPFHEALRRHAIRTVAVTAIAGSVITGGVGASVAQAETQAGGSAPAPTDITQSTPVTGTVVAPNQVGARRAAIMHQAVQRAKVAAVSALRAKVVKLAKAQIGDPYRAGRAGPNAFDCLGLTSYVYKHAAGINLPHLSYSQWDRIKRVRYRDALPGDLVFYFRGGAHHVGIYVGHGKMVNAVNPHKGVRLGPVTGSWYSRSYSGMGRLIAPAA